MKRDMGATSKQMLRLESLRPDGVVRFRADDRAVCDDVHRGVTRRNVLDCRA